MGLLAIATCLLALYIPGSIAEKPDYDQAIDNGTYGPYPVRTYMTEGDLVSPRINWPQSNPACDDGLFTFITPKGHAVKTPGPMILDVDGELVWTHHFANAFGGQAYGLRVQQYQGEDYLTFWLGDDLVLGHGSGAYYMLNSSYDIVHVVNAADGFDADLHEFLITPRGTALMTVYDKHYTNLTEYRTFNAFLNPDEADPHYVWDCLVQEISLHTHKQIFQWRASDHIALTETHRPVDLEGTFNHPWDWYHMNSIEKDDLGNYLVSSRFTFTLFYVDGRTGDVLWRLGGRRNDFEDLDGESLLFAWQHDARLHDIDAFPDIYRPPPPSAGKTVKLMTLFDNGRDQRPSRGLLLELTIPNVRHDHHTNGTGYTVRTIKTYEHPSQLQSSSQGSMQIIPGYPTKVLLGYGYDPVWTEFDINGTLLCDVHFAPQSTWESGDVQSYRVYKHAWKGLPRTPPKLEQSNDGLTLFMSWNGATEVRTWIIQASADTGDGEAWKEIARTSKRGFETAVVPPITKYRSKRYLRALALDQHGNTLLYGVSDCLDRGEVEVDLLTMVQDISNEQLEEQPVAGLATVLILLAVLAILYRLLRRCWSIRYGRTGGSPIRWKQGSAYRRIVGDV